MVELVASLVDRLRAVSGQQWLIRLVLALVGAGIIVACSAVTRAPFSVVTPVVAAILLVFLVGLPESVASIGFLALAAVWWLLAWHGSLWLTVAMATLLGLEHLLCALAIGPSHSVVARSAVRFAASRTGLYVLVTAAVGASVAALSTLPTARWLAWLAAVALSASTLVATLLASTVDESGQPPVDLLEDDDDFLPEELAGPQPRS